MDQLEGTVTGTVFRNPENGYSVVQIQSGRREYTVVGILPELAPGEQGIFAGQMVEHPQYGSQLKCTQFQLQIPSTLLGMERFLGSGLIAGIGRATAKRIVEHFKLDTMEVFSEHPERLSEIRGLGKKKIKLIVESYQEHMQAREAMIFLQSYGVSPNMAVKISKRYGEKTSEIIRQNPYRLCEEIQGIGFATADRIASALGIEKDSPDRIRAALVYVLMDAAAGSGHCFLPEAELLDKTSALLQVNRDSIFLQISSLVLEHALVREGPMGSQRVYLTDYFRAELEVADRLMDLYQSVPGQPAKKADRQIDQFEKRSGISFSPRQREAISAAMSHGVLVITGGPGTGKTTIINCIISLLSEEGSVLLAAPTGRAAKRMSEATGMEARTIHRLLEFSGDEEMFGRNQDEPLECACLILDEMSMVDLMLMRSLLRAVQPGTRLIMVGDADQLPSVGAGNVLGDILAASCLPSVRLTDIFRQSEESRIVVNAHRIQKGELPLYNEKHSDFFFDRRQTPVDCANTVVELVATRLPAFMHYGPAERMRAIQVLSPTKKGDAGVQALNVRLQQQLNPPHGTKQELHWGETVFRLGDKVMQVRNNYDLEWTRLSVSEEGTGVFNGDIGYVSFVDAEDHLLKVIFDDDREAVYTSDTLEDLDLAYCLTVHKSQGSEFPVVVIPAMPGPSMLLTRNLFYTALTRARDLVVLVGREDVIAQMVHNDHISRRYTTLAARLSNRAAEV